MTLFVNKIPIRWKEKDIKALFEVFGTVTEINIPIDKKTRQGRGFCFVTLDDAVDGRAAIDALNGTSYDDRIIEVAVSMPKVESKLVAERRNRPKHGPIDMTALKKKLPPWKRKEY